MFQLEFVVDELIPLSIFVFVLKKSVFLHVEVIIYGVIVVIVSQFIIGVTVWEFIIEIEKQMVAIVAYVVPRVVELAVIVVGRIEVVLVQIIVATQLHVLQRGV